MLVGTVVGNVWSTVKDPSLQGLRLLVVQPFTAGEESAETIVAADTLGAGVGERVLVVFGRAANGSSFLALELPAADQQVARLSRHRADGGRETLALEEAGKWGDANARL